MCGMDAAALMFMCCGVLLCACKDGPGCEQRACWLIRCQEQAWLRQHLLHPCAQADACLSEASAHLTWPLASSMLIRSSATTCSCSRL